MGALIKELPDLKQSLQARDLGYLRIVAEWWDVSLEAANLRIAVQRLLPALLDPRLVTEVVELLPDQAREALDDLLQNHGCMPWALFTRRYGVVREMGPGRRDRERPDRNAPSAAEMLWYRALLARTFFDSSNGPQEYAYIPVDLLALIPAPENTGRPLPGRAATPMEQAIHLPSNDHILDHACTLLAALRLGISIEAFEPLQNNTRFAPTLALQRLLSSAGLIDAHGLPLPEPCRAFLEAGRGEALLQLFRAWLHSPTFDELRLLPGLVFEGGWQNDPLRARNAIMDFLSTVPGRRAGEDRPYWSLAAFIAAVRQDHPDFQRPAGDYDSWYIRQEGTGEYLRGFEHWDEVDGALIRFLITGPLHWLGILDLAAAQEGGAVTAFRYSGWVADLLEGVAPSGLPEENETLQVYSNGSLRAPRLSPRSVRYQIARFSRWEKDEAGVYNYRLTPASLERARQQGLRLNHLLALLRRYAPTVPPNLVRALERWDEHGSPARLERVLVLRLDNPELLQALRSSRAARFLGDPLGPTTVVVKPGAWEKVVNFLAEMGYLAETDLDEG